MAITSMDQLVTALNSAIVSSFYIPTATTAAGGFTNLQRASTSTWGQMAIPGTAASGGTLHTQADVGFPKLSNSTSTRYLAKIDTVSTTIGTTFVYDRVWSCSGFSGTVTTAQAVTNFPTLTRPDANGLGLEIWIECYTATGATSANITVQYTNQDGVAGRNTVSVAHITSMPANRMYQVPLQAGDTGVRSIQSVTLSGTTGTAGNFGVTLMRRETVVPTIVANAAMVMDFASIGMPKIDNGSAINLINLGSTTTTGNIFGSLTFVDG